MSNVGAPAIRGMKGVKPYSKSVEHFCKYIDHYIRLVMDPKFVGVVCENQAEAVRITKKDINGETIDLLLETLLSVINHMGEKWLKEYQRQAAFLLPKAEQSATQEAKNICDAA